MKLSRRKFLHLAATSAALPATARISHAQAYPSRPMSMIVPFAAGGPQDVLGRLIAQRMSEILGQQIIIENIGGAGGVNGSKRVRRPAQWLYNGDWQRRDTCPQSDPL